MIRSASSLRESSRNKKAINGQIKDILDAMQVKMAEANKEGRCNIEFPVPKQFVAFPNDPDSELMIIAGCLRELKQQEYNVEITDIGHSLLFDIRWLADLTDVDRERMKRLLSEHMVRPVLTRQKSSVGSSRKQLPKVAFKQGYRPSDSDSDNSNK